MVWTKYCKSLYISDIQQFLKSCKNIADVNILVTSYPQIAYRQNILTQFAMQISDGHKSLSSEISTDGSFESGDSDISEDDFLFGYVEELEYKKEELKSMELSDDNKSNSDEKENDLNSSRQENFYSSKSSHYNVMTTFIKCKCCKELEMLERSWFGTNHEGCDTLILYESHLCNIVVIVKKKMTLKLVIFFVCMFLSCHIRVSEWIHTL